MRRPPKFGQFNEKDQDVSGYQEINESSSSNLRTTLDKLRYHNVSHTGTSIHSGSTKSRGVSFGLKLGLALTLPLSFFLYTRPQYNVLFPMQYPSGYFNNPIVVADTRSEKINGNEVNFDFGVLSDIDAKLSEVQSSRREVCLISSNPRTASVFISKYLDYRGNGHFDYLTTSDAKNTKCKDLPIIKMVFQKDLPSWVSSKSIDYRKATYIVHGDEFCRCPNKYCSTDEFAPVRQYYSRKYDNIDADIDTVTPPMYMPLGPRYDVVTNRIEEDDLKPSQNRQYYLNFIASPTNTDRRSLLNMLKENPYFAKDSSKYFVHMTPGWSKMSADNAAGYIKAEQYREILLESIFTLCPAGHNSEAFRIFEAVEAGSIPVIALNEGYKRHACEDSFAPFLKTGAPFVVLNDWKELPEVLESLISNPEELMKRQESLLQWNKRFWIETTSRFECLVLERHFGKDNPHIPETLGCSSKWKASALTLRKSETINSETAIQEQTEENEKDSPLQVDETETVPTALGKPETADVSIDANTPVNHNPSTTPLITGCGRSGTLSLASYLKSVGIPAIHEGMKEGAVSVSWLYAAPDSKYLSKYPFEPVSSAKYRKEKQKLLRPGESLFGPVVHLVRHPLKVISSTRRCFCGRGMRTFELGRKSDLRSWKFVAKHIPSIAYGATAMRLDSVERSALYWLHWNKLIMKNFPGAVVLQLETITGPKLVTALNLKGKNTTELPDEIRSAAFHTSPLKEKKKLPDVTWSQLRSVSASLAEAIFNLAQHFGYEKSKTLDEVSISRR